jgi:tetratricopeptide (TPR) repeat protein
MAGAIPQRERIARKGELGFPLANKNLEIDENFYPGLLHLGLPLLQTGEPARAVNAFQRATEISNRSTMMQANLAAALASSGRYDEARKILRELVSGGRYVSQTHVAGVYAALGERDRAVAALERAEDEHCPWRLYVPVDARFDTLRGGERFEACLRRWRGSKL